LGADAGSGAAADDRLAGGDLGAEAFQTLLAGEKAHGVPFLFGVRGGRRGIIPSRPAGTPRLYRPARPTQPLRVGPMPVVLLGTLDTKGTEFRFVRDLLNQAGVPTLVIDAGVVQPPAFPPDVGREEVYRAAGTSLEAVARAADRGQAVEAA